MNSNDYSPFGVQLDGRTQTSDKYRYGFQGQEKDDEISGEGNSYTAEFWQFSPRLGKRWNIDPIDKPYESSYSIFANNPIIHVDPKGADTIRVMSSSLNSAGEAYEDGDERLYLFTAYTDDSEKGDRTSSWFLARYQTLGDNVTFTKNGTAQSVRSYARFISANENTNLLKKAMHVTSLDYLNKFEDLANDWIGGSFSSYEKWTGFGHGEEFDYKSSVAKGMKLSYIEGVGVFESDHIGNLLYGMVSEHYTETCWILYEGDYYQDGYFDDPLDSYALVLGVLSDAELTAEDFGRMISLHKVSTFVDGYIDDEWISNYNIKYKKNGSSSVTTYKATITID